MFPTTASVPDSPTTALDTDALILRHYAEIARYAVQLAVNRMSVTTCHAPNPRALVATCDVCQNVAEPDLPVRHDESCVVGRIFRIAAEIATLKATATERLIEYAPQMIADTHALIPARTVSHEQAARERAVTA